MKSFICYRLENGNWRVLSEHFTPDAARELVAFAVIAGIAIRLEAK